MTLRTERPHPAEPYGAPVPVAALDLLALARHGLTEAARSGVPTERYATAHLAALRAAAAVLAARTRPTSRRSVPRNVWTLLAQAAPELTEWAAFFAAGAGKRAAAEAGLTRAVTPREADDLVRDAETFLALVETTLGVLPQQPDRPPAWSSAWSREQSHKQLHEQLHARSVATAARGR